MMGRGLLWLAAGIPGAEEKRGYLWIFIDMIPWARFINLPQIRANSPLSAPPHH